MSKTALRCLILSLLCLPLACTGHVRKANPRGPSTTGSRTTPGDLRPVVDTSPYWCDLIPRESLTRVSGAERGLTEVRYPDNTAGQQVCGLKDTGRYGPLGVMWDLKNGRATLAANLRQLRPDRPRPLPAGLGSGFVAYSPRTAHLPYESGLLFQCGADTPWIYIALRRISTGRNATEDLTELMRIAERRFGRIHHCSPVPLRKS